MIDLGLLHDIWASSFMHTLTFVAKRSRACQLKLLILLPGNPCHTEYSRKSRSALTLTPHRAHKNQ